MLKKLLLFKDKLFLHQGFVKYASNISWLMAEKIIRMVVGVLVGIWITRYLGPEQYGVFSYVQSIVVFLMAFCTLGLDSVLVRELVIGESQKNALLGSAFLLKLLAAIIAIPVLLASLMLFDLSSSIVWLVFVASLAVIFQSINVIDCFYQSIVMSKYVAWANSIVLGLSSVVKIVLILTQSSLYSFVLMGVFDAIVLAMGLLYFYSRQNRLLDWKFDKKTAIRLIKQSLPLLIAGIMFMTYSKIDQLMIAYFYDMTQVGYYSASLRLVEVFYIIPALFTSAFFPAILKAKEHSESLYALRMQRLVLLCLIPCTFICLIFSFSAEFWIGLLYGKTFLESAIVFQWQIWLLILTCIGHINGIWFISEKLEWQVAINYSIAMISNVLLNYLIIPHYGLLGAVYASIISQTVVYYGLLWCNTKSRYLAKHIYTLSLFRRDL